MVLSFLMAEQYLYVKTVIYFSILFLISICDFQRFLYPLILGNIRTNDLIPPSKYPIKYFFINSKLFFDLINFKIGFLHHKILLLLLLYCQISILLYNETTFVVIFFLYFYIVSGPRYFFDLVYVLH